jgi:L-amino acid N-acyltransferase YncA
MTQVSVRDSTDRDVPAIHAIYGHHVLHGLGSFEEVPPSLDEIARRRAEILAKGLPYLVAVGADGGVLGYCYAGPYRTRAAYRFTLENSVYIAPDATRRGVGKRLLTELIQRCTALGYRQMVAIIGDSGNTGSIGLHAMLGFHKIGNIEAVGWKHGRWVDSLVMQRVLGPGSTIPPDTAS